MNLPHAVIIAGGNGSRLGGVRKADLQIGGQRLIDRVSAALGPVAAPLLLATGHTMEPSGHFTAIADLNDSFGGPLAGLAAAIDWLTQHEVTDSFIVSVAVDTPFLPTDFVATSLEALGSHAAIYARWGEEFYPPNALWRLSALAKLPARVRNGTAPKSLKALLGELNAICHDWQYTSPLNPFDNLNNLTDLVRLQRRAQQA